MPASHCRRTLVATALLDTDDAGRLYALSLGPDWWPEQHPLVVVVVRDGWIYGSAEFSTAAFWRLPVAGARWPR